MKFTPHIILWLCAVFGAGYFSAWLMHGGLIKRIKNTRYYAKNGHSFKRAWKYAGVTL